MANGETITEIKTLLAEEGAIPTKTALRLSLDLQLQIFEKQAIQDTKQKELEERIRQQEDTNIIMWIRKIQSYQFFYLVCISLLPRWLIFEKLLPKRLALSRKL